MTGRAGSCGDRPGQGRPGLSGRRAAGSGGADFVVAVAEQSGVEAAAKLGEPLILEAAERRMTRSKV